MQEFLEAETRQLPNGVYTTAEQRPNAYIPEAEATLPLPKPYGALAPFKPSEPGANIRHIREPVINQLKSEHVNQPRLLKEILQPGFFTSTAGKCQQTALNYKQTQYPQLPNRQRHILPFTPIDFLFHSIS